MLNFTKFHPILAIRASTALMRLICLLFVVICDPRNQDIHLKSARVIRIAHPGMHYRWCQ